MSLYSINRLVFVVETVFPVKQKLNFEILFG